MSLKQKSQEQFERYRKDGLNEDIVDTISSDVLGLLAEVTKQIRGKLEYYENLVKEYSRDGMVNKEWFISIQTLKDVLAILEGN
jgi:hypothetical protein